MGEVVDMTGRVVVADEHPLGAESVEHVSEAGRDLLRAAWEEAPGIALWFKDRHDFDYDDAVICLVHSLLREAQQASERSPEAYFVLEFIGRSIYGLGDGDRDSSESS